MNPRDKNNPHRLIVEGSDGHTVIQLAMKHGCNWDKATPGGLPYIHAAGGIDKVLAEIPTSVVTYRRLGIIVDADEMPRAQWKRVVEKLASKDIIAPQEPPEDGCILQTEECRIGVWMMPDNTLPGKLEDFVKKLVPPEDTRWEHANHSVGHARQLGAPVKDADVIKAHLHTWLAWQEKPGVSFGMAIQYRYLLNDTKESLALMSWFKRLFIED